MRYYKVLSLNVNGIKNPIKRSKIVSKLKREKIDIAFLQETQYQRKNMRSGREWDSKIFIMPHIDLAKKEEWPF